MAADPLVSSRVTPFLAPLATGKLYLFSLSLSLSPPRRRVISKSPKRPGKRRKKEERREKLVEDVEGLVNPGRKRVVVT